MLASFLCLVVVGDSRVEVATMGSSCKGERRWNDKMGISLVKLFYMDNKR